MTTARATRTPTQAVAPAAAPVRAQPAPTRATAKPWTVSGPPLLGASVLQRRPDPSAPTAPSLVVAGPDDAAEREADAIADRVVHLPPAPARPGVRAPASAQRKAIAAPSAALAGDLQAALGGGAPLAPAVRAAMEPRFLADFGPVRVHTDDRASRMALALGARAFTYTRHIFFARGAYAPDSVPGRWLLVHELTHTIQQGAVRQREGGLEVAQRTSPRIQRGIIDSALDYIASNADTIPGFGLLSLVLGVNPINMRKVERNAANLMRALVGLMPGGALISKALDTHGVFDRAGAFAEKQLHALRMSGAALKQALTKFLDSLSYDDVFRLGSVFERAKRIFTEPYETIKQTAIDMAGGIVDLIKDAILRPLAKLAEGTRGYDLLKAVLGQDPITGDKVLRTAETLIGGFMKLIGQEEIWENIKKSNAIDRTWAWFQKALAELVGFVKEIPRLFVDALKSLGIADIILLPSAYIKVGKVFAGFVGKFVGWAGETVWNLLEIVFSVIAPRVMPYLKKAAAAFKKILKDPIGFVGNLVKAGVQGLKQFAGNFLKHLRASLIGWLTGTLSGASIYIPQGFDLKEIVKFVLSVLGLTWQNVRQKLVRAVGETAVRVMETGFDLVVTLVKQGPAAAWEKIKESLANLRDMVMEQVMTFVRDRVVQAAITKLVTSLNPAGAFIQAVIAIYNTVMFFIERLRQIVQVAMSFIDSISAIASGALAPAASRVEQTMAGLLTLVISFLARIAGLGKVSDAVVNIVNKVRMPIDKALDKVVEWIVAQAKKLGRFIANSASNIVGWLGIRNAFTTRDGDRHTMYFAQKGTAASLMIRSVEMSLEIFLADLARKYTSDRDKTAKVTRAQQLVAEIQAMTATPPVTAPGRAAPPSIDAAVEGRINELGVLLQEIGDGVSTEGATSAYRGLHWWLPENPTGGEDQAYHENLARQYIGVRQLSNAVKDLLTRTIPSGVQTESQIDAAVLAVRTKLAQMNDRVPYTAKSEGTYFDRFHFLLGRFVVDLDALNRRIQEAGEQERMDQLIAKLKDDLAALDKQSGEHYLKKRELGATQKQAGRLSHVPSVYRDIRPEIQDAPFISTSLDPSLTAAYALGLVYTGGRKKRESGKVGRVLIFVMSVKDLVDRGIYDIEKLRKAGTIKISENLKESELTFGVEIPGSYLRATLDVEASQSARAIAGNILGRAAAEAQRFGGLRKK